MYTTIVASNKERDNQLEKHIEKAITKEADSFFEKIITGNDQSISSIKLLNALGYLSDDYFNDNKNRITTFLDSYDFENAKEDSQYYEALENAITGGKLLDCLSAERVNLIKTQMEKDFEAHFDYQADSKTCEITLDNALISNIECLNAVGSDATLNKKEFLTNSDLVTEYKFYTGSTVDDDLDMFTLDFDDDITSSSKNAFGKGDGDKMNTFTQFYDKLNLNKNTDNCFEEYLNASDFLLDRQFGYFKSVDTMDIIGNKPQQMDISKMYSQIDSSIKLDNVPELLKLTEGDQHVKESLENYVENFQIMQKNRFESLKICDLYKGSDMYNKMIKLGKEIRELKREDRAYKTALNSYKDLYLESIDMLKRFSPQKDFTGSQKESIRESYRAIGDLIINTSNEYEKLFKMEDVIKNYSDHEDLLGEVPKDLLNNFKELYTRNLDRIQPAYKERLEQYFMGNDSTKEVTDFNKHIPLIQVNQSPKNSIEKSTPCISI